jgi:hypothetical protein
MREDSEWIVEFLNKRPSERSSKSPSSQDSIRVLFEVIDAMRPAKDRLLFAMLCERECSRNGVVTWCCAGSVRVHAAKWLGAGLICGRWKAAGASGGLRKERYAARPFTRACR